MQLLLPDRGDMYLLSSGTSAICQFVEPISQIAHGRSSIPGGMFRFLVFRISPVVLPSKAQFFSMPLEGALAQQQQTAKQNKIAHVSAVSIFIFVFSPAIAGDFLVAAFCSYFLRIVALAAFL